MSTDLISRELRRSPLKFLSYFIYFTVVNDKAKHFPLLLTVSNCSATRSHSKLAVNCFFLFMSLVAKDCHSLLICCQDNGDFPHVIYLLLLMISRSLAGRWNCYVFIMKLLVFAGRLNERELGGCALILRCQ